MKLGKWITANNDKPFYARKKINVSHEITNAEALVTGLGQFNFFIDGNKVSDHVLDPGWTDYRKTVLYVKFDVTKFLSPGEHELMVEVGNGWYIWDMSLGYSFKFPEFMPENPNPYHPFGKCLVCNMKLDLTYIDGKCETFITDDSWQVRAHEVKQSNVYGSEFIEAKEEVWKIASYADEDSIPKGELKEQQQPPIKVIKSYKGRLIKEIDGVKIYDLGQNISGILRASVRGSAGNKIVFRPAEKLDKDGMVDQMAKGWMNIDSTIIYVIKASNEIEKVKQTFTYFAGRYISVEGDCEIVDIYGDGITSAWQDAGIFTCDDERYNQIYNMIEKTVEANMMSVHTDCPTIERFAWQEPNHLMGPSIMFMKKSDQLWQKFLSDMRDAQHTAEDKFFDYEGNEIYPGEGLIPSQAPCYVPNVIPVPGMGSFYDIIPWGSSIILATRWHYIFYGDKAIIEENYDAGVRYFNHLKTKINDELFINHGLGDWGNPDDILARENVETAFLYADAKTLAWFAGELGLDQEAEDFIEYADKIKANYNAKLLHKDSNGKYTYYCFNSKEISQSILAIPLYWGMVPDYAINDIVSALKKSIEERGALVAGEIGMPYIIQSASKYGMNDLIAECIMKEQHPSYYAFIKDGMTTLGEYWKSNPRSHCHDMMGHIIEWYFSGMAGIEIVEPGFKKIKLHPYMPSSMNNFHCEYETPFGKIEIDAKRENGEVIFTYNDLANQLAV